MRIYISIECSGDAERPHFGALMAVICDTLFPWTVRAEGKDPGKVCLRVIRNLGKSSPLSSWTLWSLHVMSAMWQPFCDLRGSWCKGQTYSLRMEGVGFL